MTPPSRHRQAVARTLSWARRAAREGDYAEAVSWLDTVRAVEGGLPDELQRQRERWLARMEADRRRRGRPGGSGTVGSSPGSAP